MFKSQPSNLSATLNFLARLYKVFLSFNAVNSSILTTDTPKPLAAFCLMLVTNRCLWSRESVSRHGNIGKAIDKSHCQMINLNTRNESELFSSLNNM